MIRSFLKAISQYTDLREVLKRLSSHTDLTCSALDRLLRLVDCEECSTLALFVEEIRRLEKEGDDLIRTLTIEILKLVLPPQQLQILTILLDKLDDMLDNVTLTGNELFRYLSQARDRRIWHQLRGKIREMIVLARDEVSRVSILLREGSLEKVNESLTSVMTAEQNVDNIKNNLLDELMSHSESLTCTEIISLRNIVLGIDEVADLAKDVVTLLLVLQSISRL